VAQRVRKRPVPQEYPIGEEPGAAPAPADDAPPLDSSTFELRYRYSRARRNARIRRRQESRLARFRFYIAMVVLVAIAIAFVVGSWHVIQHVFGL
jgi:hypothetical protein